MAKLRLAPPQVNLKRRIPQHYINFTCAHIVKIAAYLPYYIQHNVITIMIIMMTTIIILIIIISIIIPVFLFGFLYIYKRYH